MSQRHVWQVLGGEVRISPATEPQADGMQAPGPYNYLLWPDVRLRVQSWGGVG